MNDEERSTELVHQPHDHWPSHLSGGVAAKEFLDLELAQLFNVYASRE